MHVREDQKETSKDDHQSGQDLKSLLQDGTSVTFFIPRHKGAALLCSDPHFSL